MVLFDSCEKLMDKYNAFTFVNGFIPLVYNGLPFGWNEFKL
jgi:hypothetical protein